MLKLMGKTKKIQFYAENFCLCSFIIITIFYFQDMPVASSTNSQNNYQGNKPVGGNRYTSGLVLDFNFLCLSLNPYSDVDSILESPCCGVRERKVVEFLSRPRGRGFEPHRPHCVLVPEQDTFILA